MTKPTKWHVRPVKTQISLGIRPVWSESSLCAKWVAKDQFCHDAAQYEAILIIKEFFILMQSKSTEMTLSFTKDRSGQIVYGWMSWGFMFLFQQYFSHIRTMEGWTQRALCNEAQFRLQKESCLWRDSNPKPRDPQSEAPTARPRWCFDIVELDQRATRTLRQCRTRWLLLKEWAAKGPHCLPFSQHLLDALLCGKPMVKLHVHYLHFRRITAIFSGVQIFLVFTCMQPIITTVYTISSLKFFSHLFSCFLTWKGKTLIFPKSFVGFRFILNSSVSSWIYYLPV